MTEPFDDSATRDAIERLYALKRTKRTGWLRAGVDPARCESVADHAFFVVLLAALGSDESVRDPSDPSLDRLKVLEFAIVHDLAESIVGDLTPEDCPRAEKIARERAAMEDLCRSLPGGPRWLAIWEAYERQDSPEARFVRAIDRREMAWQARLYARDEGIDPEPFVSFAKQDAAKPTARIAD